MICGEFSTGIAIIKNREIYCQKKCNWNKHEPRLYLNGHGRNFAPCQRYETCEALKSGEAKEELIFGKNNIICNKNQCSHLDNFEFDSSIIPICLNHGLIEKTATQQPSQLLA